MCDAVGKAVQMSMSRRTLLRSAGVAGAAAAVGGGWARGDAKAAVPAQQGLGDGRDYRTRLVLLGTAGGPSLIGGRHGIASAIVVEDAVYLIDCGHGAQLQFREAGIGSNTTATNRSWEGLKAIFLTHLHSDHTVEYPAFQITGMWNGLDDPTKPVHIYGPGDRGVLPPVFGNGAKPAVINPGDPTPGTEKMTAYLHQAYATDLNDRIRNSGAKDPARVLIPHDIPLPAGAGDDPNGNPSPRMEPFRVYEDDRVRVTAALVNHAPVFPSFGFRFDTDDGSITVSGDTAPSDNLIELGKDTDILLHEVIDRAWVQSLFGPGPYEPPIQALIAHLLGAHTSIEDVGPVAERAGAGRLVLTHLAPADNPKSRWNNAQKGFSGRLIVGEDLMQLGVGTRQRQG